MIFSFWRMRLLVLLLVRALLQCVYPSGNLLGGFSSSQRYSIKNCVSEMEWLNFGYERAQRDNPVFVGR